MIYITAIHMVGGSGHEHIAEVRWIDPATNQTKQTSRASMVDFIRKNPGITKVTDGRNTVDVGVWDANPPYLRTYADKNWTDNLLSLPRY